MWKVASVAFVAACLCASTAAVPTAGAQVSFSLGVNVGPPAHVFYAPPPVVPIPRTYVYYVPDIGVDVFYHQGYWYRPYEAQWYRARHYNGPWVYVYPKKIPAALVSLPPNYRYAHPAHRPIPYGQVKKQWKHRERERHWD